VGKVSLKILAKELGVSVATVSLVLTGKNGNGRVSKEMSKKIQDKAKELNYAPNNLAQGLKMGKSKAIGLIVADISNSFFGTLALHIQNYAQQKGYTVIIGNTNEQLSEMERMIHILKSRQVDGLIMTPTEASEDLILKLEKEKIPLVLVDRAFPTINTNRILINNYEISRKATQELIRRGCKNIALLTYKEDHFHINERKRGWLDTLKEAKMYKPENVKKVKYGELEKDVDQAIAQLLMQEDRIDGIFFVTNSISILGVKSLYKRKVKVQEDLQILCFDQSDLFDLLPYSIPYIEQPIELMAKKSADLIIEHIEGKEKEVEVHILEAELVLK